MKNEKILLVDDDEISRTLLREIISDYPNVYEAADGLDAMTFLQRNPDTALVLLDLQMPRMDGFAVLAHIRMSPWLSEVPVLILSASTSSDVEMTALKLGATEFASKPYQAPFLRQKVANLLQLPTKPNNCQPGSILHQMYIMSQAQACGLTVFEMHPDHSIHTIFFSDSFAKICGYTPKEYKGFVKDGSDLERILPIDERIIFSQAAETLLIERQPVYQTLRIQRKDKAIADVSMNLKVYGEVMGSTIFHAVTIDLQNPPKPNDSLVALNLGKSAFDPLTQIYNRETFCSETQQMLLEHPNCDYMLIVWDIDRFKVVNDLFGTRVGDNILVKVASHLKKLFFGYGTFGRLDSDMFAFCVPAERFELEQMLKSQSTLCSSVGIHYNMTIHNGIYPIQDKSIPVSTMCDRARMALETVKDNYVLRYAYYDEEIRQTMLTEQQILNDMHRALNEGEFLIYLQPIYSLNFDKPVSAEVLVRWQHPRMGLITPAQFIPLFEKNRFITEFDRHIWDLTCQYLASRKARNLPIVPLSVNMSRANFAAPDLPHELTSIVKKYNLPPSLLRLEMTESAYVENPLQLMSAARRLQKFGFKILLDDFGSGYSSLKMLKDLPLDILKIDMRFLEDLEQSPRAAAVLLGVVKIAQSLNMVTIAEGVESKFQLDFLRTAGCDNIQGYFYAKPMPTADFDKLLENPPVLE